MNLKNFHKQNEKVKKNELSLNLSSFQYSTNTHEHHRTESYSPNAKIPIHNNLNEIIEDIPKENNNEINGQYN